MGGEQPKGDRRFTPADRLALSVGCVSLVGGVILLSLAHGIVASTIAIALLGASAIAFVALAFLLVGESEDRDYRKGPPRA